MEKSPWEELRDQVVLGSEEFLETIRAHVIGDAREQHGARGLARARPKLEEIIANLEKAKGLSWAEIRDRHGDDGRDLVLCVGRRACGLKLRELAVAVGMSDYSAVSIAIRRYERRLKRSRARQALLKEVCQLSNVEM